MLNHNNWCVLGGTTFQMYVRTDTADRQIKAGGLIILRLGWAVENVNLLNLLGKLCVHRAGKKTWLIDDV